MGVRISVIVPVYNSEQTLKRCLDSIFNSSYKEYEVLVVSDNSTDKSVEIARRYNCNIIESAQNKGAGYSRNLGAEKASGEILLFIDSDIVIKSDALQLVARTFDQNEINAVQGIYSHEPNYNSIATQFQQSFYCYYTWNKKIKYVETLTSACFGIRKKVFMNLKGFNSNIKNATSEDEEFGYKLIDGGNKILILRELSVVHLVNYSLAKFVKRCFVINFATMKSFLRNRSFIKKKVTQNNYKSVLAGIFIIGLIIITLFLTLLYKSSNALIIFLLLNFVFLFLNINFFNFVYSSKGIIKALGVLFTCYLNSFLMLLSISCACLSYFFGKKY